MLRSGAWTLVQVGEQADWSSPLFVRARKRRHPFLASELTQFRCVSQKQLYRSVITYQSIRSRCIPSLTNLRSSKIFKVVAVIAARFVAVLILTIGSPISHDAFAQTPSSSNYRSLAVCEEVLVQGRWFHSFGEGRCPPGSRRAPRAANRGVEDVNARSLMRMDAQVQALASAQQSLISAGRAISERYQNESDARLATYAYHFAEQASVANLYSAQEFLFPLKGNTVYAQLGDPILTASNGFYSSCFVPLEDGVATQIGGHRHNVRRGELTCKLKERDRAFTPLYSNYSFSGGDMSMGQTLDRKDGLYTICYRSMGVNAMCVRGIPADKVIETTGIVELIQTSRIAATFRGVRDGQLEVHLEQSEAVPSQIIIFDLSSSREIEILGVTFDVLEFSDNEIVLARK